MKKVTDYEILEYDDKYYLEKKVKEYIEKFHYELYGSPFTYFDYNYKKITFCQAMVKYEEI